MSLSASTKNRFVLVQAEAHNAELAAKHAARQANTMIPGISGFVEVQQLAIPNDLKTNKEEAFIQQVLRIGEFMNVPLTELFLHTIGKKTTVWRFVLWQSVFLRTTRPNFWLVSVFAKELNFSKRWPSFGMPFSATTRITLC